MYTPTHPARLRAQLTAADVTVTRGGTRILHGVNLAISPGSRVAIVGENGRGKSTLQHLLAGKLLPDEGTITRVGTIGLAEQEMSAENGKTVGDAVSNAIAVPLAAVSAVSKAATALAAGRPNAEDQYADALAHAEALDAWDAERRVHLALEALDAETDLGRRLEDLSVGQRYRVRLACLLGADDDFLLLDEPTNHLDHTSLDFLTEALRTRRGGVVLVSHDRALLADIAETIVDLDPSADRLPRIYGDGYLGYQGGRQQERERWEHAYARQQAELTRLQRDLSEAQNRLVTGWRPEKGTPKHQRATRAGGLVQSVHRRREQLEAHAITVPEPPQQFRFPDLTTRSGATLLTASKVTVTGRLHDPVTVTLSHRDRLVVTGPNGAGKSTLLSVLAGELSPDTGWASTAEGTRLGYLRQESRLPHDRRASDVFQRHLGSLVARGIITDTDTVGLSQLGLLRSSEASKRIGHLSTGQLRRLDLALVLAARPHVLLLDEPTNHLSITLVDELTEALGATKAAVVLSSHDRQLLRDTHQWPQLTLRQQGSTR